MGTRKDIMLATMFTRKLFDKISKPVYVQAKIEGDRLRAKMNTGDDSIKLYSSGGKVRVSLPHIQKELATLSNWRGYEVDGEAYRHGMEHSEIRSIVSRTKNLHPDHEKMHYYIFDVINDEPQGYRIYLLEQLFRRGNFKYLYRVPTYRVDTYEELQKYYDKFIKRGYEGIIIRHPYATYLRRKVTTLLKLKPRVSEYFRILNIVEEVSITGQPKGTFGSFVCITEDGQVFSVGTGVTDRQRDMIWKNSEYFIGNKVKIRFQDYTKVRRVPKMQSIDKAWIVEACDLLTN